MDQMHEIRARLAELEADNARLRRLLDQHNAPEELRHRLRSTLAMLRSIIRKSAETRRDVDSYVAHLEDRLDALVRAQATADDTGGVNLRTILADELMHYQAEEGEVLTLTGPEFWFQPRAGQIFAMAIHELAVNAVEHGALGADEGRVDIEWSVNLGGSGAFQFLWRETGGALLPMAAFKCHGFGTEVLTRMLRYELQAETKLSVGSNGFTADITFPLTDKVSRVHK